MSTASAGKSWFSSKSAGEIGPHQGNDTRGFPTTTSSGFWRVLEFSGGFRHCSLAVSDPAAWKRLGKLVARRRGQLRLTQAKAAARAEISESTWRALERGDEGKYRALTKFAIADALGWRDDALDVVLAGGEPPLADATEPPETFRLPDNLEDLERLNAEFYEDVEHEEARKALEAALKGQDPQLAALAGEWWDSPEEDRAIVLNLLKHLRERNAAVRIAELLGDFERDHGPIETYVQRTRERLTGSDDDEDDEPDEDGRE